jgi:uncharacterized cupin superfamily protein
MTVLGKPSARLAPGEEGLEEWPETSEASSTAQVPKAECLHRGPDSKRAYGIWRCTPGRVTGKFVTDEVSVITAGKMTLVLEGGARHEVESGDIRTIDDGLQVE